MEFLLFDAAIFVAGVAFGLVIAAMLGANR